MNISVLAGNWLEPTSDIECLLDNIASHINRELKNPFTRKIHVKSAPSNDKCPRTLTGKDKNDSQPKDSSKVDDPIDIQLNIEKFFGDQYPCQAAYQFAHEFSHAISNYEEYYTSPNSWLCEAIGELASIFTLHSMNKSWVMNPPTLIGKGYEKNFLDYKARNEKYCDYKKKLGQKYPELKDWFVSNRRFNLLDWISKYQKNFQRDVIEDKCELRAEYTLVAYALLPIFENKPYGWNAIREFPISDVCISDYLDQWIELHDDNEIKEFINSCKNKLVDSTCPFKT